MRCWEKSRLEGDETAVTCLETMRVLLHYDRFVSTPLTLMPARLGLPRGRAALSVAEVAESQRGRDPPGRRPRRSPPAATPPPPCSTSIARPASRATAFYDKFVDKQDAFAQAHLEASQQLRRPDPHPRRRRVGDVPWRERLERRRPCLPRRVRGRPSYAVGFMVELRAAGPRLLDQRDRVVEQHAHDFARLARAAAAEDLRRHPADRPRGDLRGRRCRRARDPGDPIHPGGRGAVVGRPRRADLRRLRGDPAPARLTETQNAPPETGGAFFAGDPAMPVARGGVEPPTYHFSGDRSYQLSYLAKRRTPYRSRPGPHENGESRALLEPGEPRLYASPSTSGPHRLAAQDPALSRR